MSAKKSLPLTLLALGLLAPLHAQQGDRKGHNMASFVPEDVIPPAPFLEVEDALKTFKLAPGYVIEPVAVEPLVEMPVILKFDGDGRMWICEMVGYMPNVDGKGEDIPQGRIVILEDTNNDGTADKRTVFMDKLLLPRSLYLLDDGILWANQNSLYFQGRDGDKPKGNSVIVDKDYARGGNVEHKANSLVLGLDNWIYNAKSDRRYKKIDGKWVMEKTHYRGQWGLDRDDYGRLYHNSNSMLLAADFTFPNVAYGNFNAKMKAGISNRVPSNRVWPIRVTPGVNRGYQKNTVSPKNYKLINATGASGFTVYRGTNFPDEHYGMAIVTEPCGNLIKALSLKDGEDAVKMSHTFGEKEFLASTDERFRPVNAYTAPDGSVYVLDMYHGIIQHRTYVTSYLRKQILSRGLEKPGNGHGRIYRIRHKEKKLGPAPKLEKLKAAELVQYLSHPNGWWRDTAQRLIVERGDAAVTKSLEAVLTNASNPLGQLHALWSLEGLGLLTAKHVTALTGSANQKLVSSALYAALALDDSGKKEVAAAVAKTKTNSETSIYLARFLAETGTNDSFNALVGVLQSSGKNRLVREAAFTGLKGKESIFIGVNNGRYQDGSFDKKGRYQAGPFEKWLTEAVSKKIEKIEPPKITGEHLASFKRGEALYMGKAACMGCHGTDGTGLPNLGPTLDRSDWVTGDTNRLVSVLLHGLQGPITVSGERFTPLAAMPGLVANPTIKDKDIADILTFVRHAWSNRSAPITEETVKETRAKTKEQGGVPYTEKDFKK